jgi:mannonate dehydratase
MPVYELLGGKCRRGAMIYSRACGREIPETIEQAHKLMSQGIKAVHLRE